MQIGVGQIKNGLDKKKAKVVLYECTFRDPLSLSMMC